MYVKCMLRLGQVFPGLWSDEYVHIEYVQHGPVKKQVTFLTLLVYMK